MKHTTQDARHGRPLSPPVRQVLRKLEKQDSATFLCADAEEQRRVQTNVLNAFKRLGDGTKVLRSKRVWTTGANPKPAIKFTVEAVA